MSQKKKKPRKRKPPNIRLQNATNYEKVTKNIYEYLSPDCTVTHDDMIMGKDSEIERQIDVSIRGKVGTHEILVIVQCKNLKNRRVNINQVGELYSVIQDVGASKGVLVSNAGFTNGAKKLAGKRGIELCSIHDAESKDWRLVLQYPVIWEEITPSFHLSFEAHLDKGDTLSYKDNPIISGRDVIEEFTEKWNNKEVDLDNNSKYPLDISSPTFHLVDRKEVPVENLQAQIKLERKFFFAYIDTLPSAKALQNESDNSTSIIIPCSDLIEIDKTLLMPLEKIEDSPVEVKEHLRILKTPRIDKGNIVKDFSIKRLGA